MELTQTFIFVYAKDGKIKVLNFEDDIKYSRTFIKDGWKHTATLDACRFIEYLGNDCEPCDFANELTELKTI